MKQSAKTFVLIVLVLVALSHDVYAYIDLGTGSFVLQMLIASILGALFTFKMWFRALKRFFLRLFGVAGNTITKTDEPPKGSIEAHSPNDSVVPVAEREFEEKP
jgi:hypothetical protein